MIATKLLKGAAPRIRRISPVLYDKALLTLFSEPVRAASVLHKLPSEIKLMRRNYPRFAVNVSSRMGLGAQMSWVAGILAYCDEHKLSPRLMFTNPAYAVVPGQDWLAEYFVRREVLSDAPGEQALGVDRYVPQSMNVMRKIRSSYQHLTLERTRDIFFRALQFRAEFIDEAEEYCRTEGVSEHTIGVHFRGTDKRLEATRVEWEEIAEAVEETLKLRGGNIFVASDEPEFLSFMRSRFPRRHVCDLGCTEIFAGRPAHLTAGDTRMKASEAIRTMIVLSRCGRLIRTRSQLSAWAKIMNPASSTIVFGEMTGGDLRGFPENLIRSDS